MVVGEESILCYFVSDDDQKIICNGTTYEILASGDDSHLKPTGWLFWTYVSIYIILVMFAGEDIII